MYTIVKQKTSSNVLHIEKFKLNLTLILEEDRKIRFTYAYNIRLE